MNNGIKMNKKSVEVKNSRFFNKLKEKHEKGVSKECMEKFYSFRSMLDELKPSKRTHYFLLEESFYDKVYQFLHEALNEFGFVNANVEHNASKPDVGFFWELYTSVDCFDNSPFYIDVSDRSVNKHHESAYVRCEVLKMEIDNFIKSLN